jgi:hypothetical protein
VTTKTKTKTLPTLDLSQAQRYIDRVLEIHRRHGVTGKVSDTAYRRAVSEAALAFRRLQINR